MGNRELSKTIIIKSRVIYWVLAVVLYVIYLPSVMGDWYLWQFLLPFMSILFVIPAVVLSFPVIRCLRHFFDTNLPKKKRIRYLVFFLIPIIVAFGFVSSLFVKYQVLTKPNVFIFRTQKKFPQYQSIFLSNKDDIEYINNNIIGIPDEKHESYSISSVITPPRGGIGIDLVNNQSHSILTTLEEAPLDAAQKEIIARVMKNLCRIGDAHIHENRIHFQINGGHALWFVKNNIISEFTGPYINEIIPLDDDWTLVVVLADPNQEKGA